MGGGDMGMGGGDMGGDGGDMGGDMGGGDMGGMMGGMGGGMGGGSMMVQALPPPDVDYLLVRFFDFKAKTGKKYRYRVRVMVEDPNRPESPALSPRERALSDEVKSRLDVVKADEQRQNRRMWYLWTEWSDPSEVIAVNRHNLIRAGQIATVPRARVEPDGALTIPTSEPSAKVMAIVWDKVNAVDVPLVTDAYRGAVLNFLTNADVIHPVTMHFKKVENFRFRTDRLVMDFEGGIELPEVKREDDDDDDDEAEDAGPQRAPTEFLFMDESGNMFVRSEFDDLTDFARYQVPEVEKKPERGGGDAGDMGGDMGGGGMDMGM